MTDWADEIAREIGTKLLKGWNLINGPGISVPVEPDIAAALRKARSDALEEAIYILVNMDCPDENAPEVTYKAPWYDGVGAAENAIRALKDKQP
jgi:hypothetical protein